MEIRRYVVLGAGGFIGSHLVARLKAQGQWVRAVDIEFRNDRAELWGQADETYEYDLRYRVGAEAALGGVDRVYHLAADHGGAGYFHSEHDQPAARNNMAIDLNVLSAAEDHDVERVFYASSFCAYPVSVQWTPKPLSEVELFEGMPEQCYGAEKRFMTQLCEASERDFRCGVFATIYGPFQEWQGIRAKFPTAIAHRVLQRAQRGAGEIELWGDGSQIRTFLYIDDALDRIEAVMEEPFYGGPVNIASDEEVTVGQCADWLCEFAGVPNDYSLLMDKPTGVAARVPDNSKFEENYPGRPQTVSTRDGFVKLYGWLKVRGA